MKILKIILILYLQYSLEKDKSFLIDVMSEKGDALKHAGSDVKNDRDVVLMVVKQNGLALEHASAKDGF